MSPMRATPCLWEGESVAEGLGSAVPLRDTDELGLGETVGDGDRDTLGLGLGLTVALNDNDRVALGLRETEGVGLNE